MKVTPPLAMAPLAHGDDMRCTRTMTASFECRPLSLSKGVACCAPRHSCKRGHTTPLQESSVLKAKADSRPPTRTTNKWVHKKRKLFT